MILPMQTKATSCCGGKAFYACPKTSHVVALTWSGLVTLFIGVSFFFFTGVIF